MKKVLINAYACSPNMGSEPGMAWNWCVNLAKYCELHIITEGEFKDKIEEVLPILPQGKNMHFYYNPVSDEVRKMCWNQGDWRFYKHYKKWQWKTYEIAKEICVKESIEILHQLNMIGFREPGYLWKLSKETGIPFVWGPVDAKDEFPLEYTEGASLKTRSFLWLKNTITKWQLRYSRRVRKAATQAKVIAASSNSVRSFKHYMDIDAVLINETGCNVYDVPLITKSNHNRFDILWVGKLDFRKQLSLALRVVAALGNNGVRLNIVGGGNQAIYRAEAERLGVSERVIWHGAVSHDEVQHLMQQSDVMLFTSVAEGTPHVVMEALANKLPVICFDTCGQGDCINDSVGVKVPLSTPQHSVIDFVNVLSELILNPERLAELKESCIERQKELSWERKVLDMLKIYNL